MSGLGGSGEPVPLPRLGDEELAGRQLVLHRHAIKPHHLESWLGLWEREIAVYTRLGCTSWRAFVETDAEPKLSWLYSLPAGSPRGVAGIEELRDRLVADDEARGIAELAAPHVFRNLLVRPVEPHVVTVATPASLAGSEGRERIAIMRRYSITGGWEEFLEVWRRIVPVREKYGFRCLFAVEDREKDMFTWAFDFDGEWPDFPAAQRGYYHDPERVELRKVFDFMADYSLHPARQLLLPGQDS